MAKDDPDVWFEPKRFGLGAGLPVAWQGWALLIGYLAAVLALSQVLAARHRVAFVAVTIALTLAMMAVAAQHTRGGWRWRWGEDE